MMTSQYHENTTVILGEVHHLFTSSMNVTEDTKHIGDFYRDVEVLQLDLRCKHLPTRTETTSITDGKDLSSINGTTLYVLAGSTVKFSVCGTTNHTGSELERLELVLRREREIIAIDFFHVGTNNERQCKDSVLSLEEPGYYTINFLLPTHKARFCFNATYNVHEIDTKQLQRRMMNNHTLHTDQDTFTFPLQLRMTYSCFVATIKDSPRTLSQTVHLQVEFSNQRIFFILIGLVPLLIFILILVTVVVLCVCLMKEYVLK